MFLSQGKDKDTKGWHLRLRAVQSLATVMLLGDSAGVQPKRSNKSGKAGRQGGRESMLELLEHIAKLRCAPCCSSSPLPDKYRANSCSGVADTHSETADL